MTNSGYLILTPPGVLHAFADQNPNESAALLQTLLPKGVAVHRQDWEQAHADQLPLLQTAFANGWVQEVQRELRAPDVRLDNYLPHAIAGLSSTRSAALALEDGFCLARVGYSEEEADTWSVAAADFLSFIRRQKQRGFQGTGRAISFHDSIDMLMPSTTFLSFWVDGVGYWLIVGGEPLLNNRALVELVWGIRVAGMKYELPGR